MSQILGGPDVMFFCSSDGLVSECTDRSEQQAQFFKNMFDRPVPYITLYMLDTLTDLHVP